jgi:hypothetical protein
VRSGPGGPPPDVCCAAAASSIETLKCLASVFDIELSKLTEEVTVIDKSSEKWLALPWWYRINLLGAKTRNSLLYTELVLLILGFVYWFFIRNLEVTVVLFLGAYIYGWLIRYGDRRSVW